MKINMLPVCSGFLSELTETTVTVAANIALTVYWQLTTNSFLAVYWQGTGCVLTVYRQFPERELTVYWQFTDSGRTVYWQCTYNIMTVSWQFPDSLVTTTRRKAGVPASVPATTLTACNTWGNYCSLLHTALHCTALHCTLARGFKRIVFGSICPAQIFGVT